MSKKNAEAAKSVVIYEVDPTECPFKDFKDNELTQEFWGLGTAAARVAIQMSKAVPKQSGDHVWIDDQTQPLPRSVRHYLHGWARAEDLAMNRWEAEVAVVDESDNPMSVVDIQLSHAQVLLRSSFCRRALSACFMLERAEGLTIEHQWENFVCNMGPEGWRPRYHIYSPGMKPGGGQQHRPMLSKNGCYLVRLFFMGAWRCVWVSDQVPVDATDSPLLPFSPPISQAAKPPLTKMPVAPANVTAPVVYLWPLLICKALLKLAAPDMNSDEDTECAKDEDMMEFDMLHALTGCLTINFDLPDAENLWNLITAEIPMFSWDDDDDTVASTAKSKGPKKPTAKDAGSSRRSLACITIDDTRMYPPYILPGFSPGQEMMLLVTMARDVPVKKPLPEPEVALWKYYRWIDWAKKHGLYDAYECPRTRFLKVNGLMKLSYAPHLLDVQSNESITYGFRAEHDRTTPAPRKTKDANQRSITGGLAMQPGKEELRDWILYEAAQKILLDFKVTYYPSMYQFTSASNNPPARVTKAVITNKTCDITAPKCSPIYIQVDNPEDTLLRISLSTLHPRVMMNSGIPIDEYIEPTYLLLERFKWFEDCEIPLAEAFVQTRGYNSVQVSFEPGRHFCRVWVHSRMNWYVMFLTESAIVLNTRDIIQGAATHECPWVTRFLGNLGSAFINWIRVNRSNPMIISVDREFYKSYQPDLTWNEEIVGYRQVLLHWMFRQALQSLLKKRLPLAEYQLVCVVLRHYFCDPDFGLPPKPKPPKSLREIVDLDPCDCQMPEVEELENLEEEMEEQQQAEEKSPVSTDIMNQLLTLPVAPVVSQVCELATEELPCGILKDEREKMIRKHEAATCIQSHWRGSWARKCLNGHLTFSPDILKIVMDNSFGNFESLSNLMNEFFGMYPGAKTAYSVASALSGVYGIQQHTGTSVVTPVCKWIAYFQGVFFCHAPVKVHFDIHSSLPNSTFAVYNNDTGQQMPQAFNAHVTFDFAPNNYGYTIMGHGSLKEPAGQQYDAHWQLTVLTSIDGVFHVCDNDIESCTEIGLQPAYKLHIDEIFLPNRRNILGGITVAVTKNEAVSFRAAATSHDLEILATLRTTIKGQVYDLAHCAGKGEIYWPYIKLKAHPSHETASMKKKSASHANLLTRESTVSSSRSVRSAKLPKPTSAGAGKNKSLTKLRGDKPTPIEPKQYSIVVTAPNGWPLTLTQWKKIDEVRNKIEMKIEVPAKKTAKDKPVSAKDKDKDKQPVVPLYQPSPEDAYTELECSLAANGGAMARRDDERDLEFAAARKAWDAKEPGRNMRGSQIRKDFRTEFLEALAVPPSESVHTPEEETVAEFFGEEERKEEENVVQQGPTPATESGMLEMSVESEEEAKFLLMPDQLRDKFIPLYFLPFCLKDKLDDESALVSPDMAEAAKQDRHARIEAAVERMKELQQYNEHVVQYGQRRRCHLLEKLFVDCTWPPELAVVLEERDEAITRETLLRSLSATKRKQEQKKK